MEQSETAEKLVKLLKKKNLTVTTAESCTGGMIASAIVSVAGGLCNQRGTSAYLVCGRMEKAFQGQF